ncbi:XRE family transcriptional regulator [Flavobacterium piscisymbiosum]|uniref:Helix-turn-helix domain-containing protein n=1 Tax=Flavobacterium piscisymbiosum TaxID=2893753 RepID=A0ABS8MLT6_9FLAO|nr:helix-turn-helix domain-containing protein [Flavobacterium sp. F-30]MCC9066333.1 helix-turn-helix domain-containing protein [Flavobacterium sp. F-30]
MDSIGERLSLKMKENGLNPNKIAVSTGIHPTTIKNYLNNIGNPDSLKLDKVAEVLDINLKWVLTGEGEVERKKELLKDEVVNHVAENLMYVPLVNQYAYGGYLNGFNDPTYIEELPKIPFLVEKEHKGDYICFEVKGDSMDDGTHESYLERDILLCRNVRKDFWKSKLHINKWDFVIVHKDNGICVKRIIKHDVEKGIITCHSLNDYYEDFDMDLRDVTKIFNIVDIQRKRNRR